MAFANPLPAWALVGVVAASGLVSWLAYRPLSAPVSRRVALTMLRFVTLLLLVVCLMRPVESGKHAGKHDAVVPVLVDTSRSMGIEDVNGRSRLVHARELLAGKLLPALAAKFDVEVLAFGEDVHATTPADLAAVARRSDLARAIFDARQRFAGRPIPGLLLLSDGGDTSGLAMSALERGAVAPIYPIGIGATTVGLDREVLSVTAAEAALDDSRVDLIATAVAHGHGSDPIELRLLENGRPIEVRRRAPAADGAPVQEVFHVTPRRGTPAIYTVEIPQAAGELVPENNRRSVLLQPPARPRRVLVVEGAPGFEHSFVKRAWAADSGLEIDAVVRKGTNDQGGDTFYIQAGKSGSAVLSSGFPGEPAALFAYDALVLANIERAELSPAQLQMVREFVSRRGGGLLVLGARSLARDGLGDTTLDEVLPLRMSDRGGSVLPAALPRVSNRVSLTDAGREHPVMQLGSPEETLDKWDRMPPLASVASLGGPRPGASVLALSGGSGGTPRALVAIQRFGEGRSMIFAGEASWRWRMLLPASDKSYERFWRQAIRWLAAPAGEPVAMTAPADAAPGDTLPVSVTVRDSAFEPTRDATVNLTVTRPDGGVEQVRAAATEVAGQFVGRFPADQPGVYRITADARSAAQAPARPSTSLLVGAADLEMTDPRLNLQLLRRIAAASSGMMITDGSIPELLGRLEAAAPSAALSVQRDLWHTGWTFAAILLLLAAEWILRRHWGLR